LKKRILIDGREFVEGRLTGIGSVLRGLTDALTESNVIEEILLVVYNPSVIPSQLENRRKIRHIKILPSFLRSEKTLSKLTKKEMSIFISPYPKLPLFGCYCPTVHIIHDVLDLTYPAYKKRLKVIFDSYRLKKALRRADLTWYVSSWTFDETKKYTGSTGKNPRVRHSGIAESFNSMRERDEEHTLKKYALKPGYILVLGNGRIHKNLGILLNIAGQLSRKIVFAGVPEKNQQYWKSVYPEAKVAWLKHILDEDLPAVLRGSFCLAQPSIVEGYGYPPLEAMACGVPAVISDIAVLRETTGGNALIASPDDSKEWVEIFGLLENRAHYTNLVEKGLKWVDPLRGRNGWQGHVSDIEEMLGAYR
jgi:glycosyltransferase involved in cell wall biosynthesis